MLNDFYHSLKRLNVGLIWGKVNENAFSLNSNIITDHHGVPKEGNTTYFDNFLYFIPWDPSSGRPHGGNSVARRRKIQESGEEKGSHNASSNILANHSVQHFATNRASKWGCWKLWNIHLLEESLIKRLMFRYLSSITYLDIKTKGEFTYPMLDYD